MNFEIPYTQGIIAIIATLIIKIFVDYYIHSKFSKEIEAYSKELEQNLYEIACGIDKKIQNIGDEIFSGLKGWFQTLPARQAHTSKKNAGPPVKNYNVSLGDRAASMLEEVGKELIMSKIQSNPELMKYFAKALNIPEEVFESE